MDFFDSIIKVLKDLILKKDIKMAKGKDAQKNEKKAPLKSPKEKKQEKAAKKANKK